MATTVGSGSGCVNRARRKSQQAESRQPPVVMADRAGSPVRGMYGMGRESTVVAIHHQQLDKPGQLG